MKRALLLLSLGCVAAVAAAIAAAEGAARLLQHYVPQ